MGPEHQILWVTTQNQWISVALKHISSTQNT